MTSEPIVLADGVPFQLGMTIYLPIGQTLEYRTILTDPAIHKIESFVHHGHVYNTIGMIASIATTDLGFFFSSPRAIYDAKAATLRREIAERQEELIQVEALALCGS